MTDDMSVKVTDDRSESEPSSSGLSSLFSRSKRASTVVERPPSVVYQVPAGPISKFSFYFHPLSEFYFRLFRMFLTDDSYKQVEIRSRIFRKTNGNVERTETRIFEQ